MNYYVITLALISSIIFGVITQTASPSASPSTYSLSRTISLSPTPTVSPSFVSSPLPCRVDGFDLTPLKLPNNNEWTYNATSLFSNNDIYYWNICGEIPEDLPYCADTASSVCQTSTNSPNQYSCGQYQTMQLSTTIMNGTAIPVVTYYDGAKCQNPPVNRATVIQIMCSPITSNYVVSEVSCTYTLQMLTPLICKPSASPLPSPSPTLGTSPCNAIKIKTLPYTYSNNLQYGVPYNSNCVEGSSDYSQFYLIVPSTNGTLNATTCGMSTVDTIINVYSGVNCAELGECVAYNDDGCPDISATQSTVALPVEPDVQYFFEVRTYGASSPGPYEIFFDLI